MKANLIFSANDWLNGKELVFDFSGKKVRCNGRVLDKFTLCSYMEDVDHKRFNLYTLYAYDVCKYNEIRDEFLQYCRENCKPYQQNPKEDAPKEDAKRNLSEKVLNGKQGKQFAYILDAITNSASATDTNKEFSTDYGKIAFFFEYFGDEFNHTYNKKLYPNLQKRIEQYLRGLPSCINIAYMNYNIIEIGKEWGYCQTEQKENKFVNDWWCMIAYRIIQIANKVGFTL